jgi:hydroxyacylglutathione hydrolase
MEVATHVVGNRLRNLNHLVACPDTGEALAVDPLDVSWIQETLHARSWRLRWIVNTHAHGDHTAGNTALAAATGAEIRCHPEAVGSVPGVARGLEGALSLGNIVLEVLDTPGHTMSHVCLFWRNGTGGKFFSGDTLFNAGAGNCHHGGHPELLYNTFSQVLSRLEDAVELYPGHDYLERNLAFTLDREPGNLEARRLLDRQGQEAPLEVMSMGEERQVNVFLRLGCEEIRSRLCTASGQVPQDDQACFLALRALRNRW